MEMESENDTVAKTIDMHSKKINRNNDLSLNRSKEKYFAFKIELHKKDFL